MNELQRQLEAETAIVLPARVVPVLFNLTIAPVISPSILVAGNGNVAIAGVISVFDVGTVNTVLLNQVISV